MSDRVLVMREGRQMAIFDRAEADQERVMTAAMGQAGSARRRVNWLQRHIRPEQAARAVSLLLADRRRGADLRLADRRLLHSRQLFNRVASSVAIIAVVAVGQTLVVLTRNIDLSVGSIVGCTAYVIGDAARRPPRACRPCSAVAYRGRASAPASGSLNGVLVA